MLNPPTPDPPSASPSRARAGTGGDGRAIAGIGLERVVAQMPAAVLVVEAGSRRILHVNARAREMTERQLGRSIPAELTTDWDIFHPDGRPYSIDEWPLIRSITSGENVVDEEYFNLLPDGRRMIVHCSSSPVCDEDGRIVAGVLVMRDVTEDKRQEEQLRYLAGLLDNTEDAVVALDADWFVTVWNGGAERMYGWTADEVVGRHTLEVARLDMSHERRAAVRRAVAERGRWRGEVVAYRKDGKPVSVELITVALRDHGELTGYLAIHRDVSDRKRAERRLHAAQQKTETILESISDTFFAVDREWRYTYVNERAVARAGTAWGRDVTAGDLLGKSCWELFPEASDSVLYDELHRAMRKQTAAEFEAYSPVTGSWFEMHAYPSKDGLSVYSRDISDRKWAQGEMRRRAEEQALVAELGQRALASDDLQSLLEDAVGLVARTLELELAKIGELLEGGGKLLVRAGIGWRSGVVGNATEPAGDASQAGYALASGGAVLAEDLASEQRFTPSAVVAEHAAVSAVTVVVRGREEPFGILDALSTRRRRFSPSDVSFMQAVANVVATAVERHDADERLVEAREVERRRIARDLHDEALQDLTHALALAPPDELSAALRRIGQELRGAIYDLRLGGEEQTPFRDLLEDLVAVHRARAGDSEIELELGDGVPAGPLGAMGIEVMRVLGEALTNVRRHAGAGRVGVHVWASDGTLHAEVDDDGRGFDPESGPASGERHGTRGMRERAEALRGRLEISSVPAVGSSVRLELPLRQDDDPAVEEVRVLLVEDHTTVREAIASAFRREAGFDVVGEAASLAEARERLDDVDVAVLDLGLPDGSGADLIEELHAASPRAEALVLTAALDRAEIARAIENGAAGALDKTAHLGEVVEAVRRLRAGETLMPPGEVVKLLRFARRQREQDRADRAAIDRLTPREHEVLDALAAGLDSRGIADRLHITVRTERNHVASILAKLGVHSQLQAVVFALQHGVIDVR